jgi:hypothetical protein
MATLPSTTTALGSEALVKKVQGKAPFVVEQEFDLDALLDAVIANADVINLLQIPANHVILAAALQVKTPGTKDATTFTLQPRFATSAIGAALDATTDEGITVGGATTYALPITVGTSAAYLNLVAVVSGGNAVATKNPKVRVQLVLVDMG